MQLPTRKPATEDGHSSTLRELSAQTMFGGWNAAHSQAERYRVSESIASVAAQSPPSAPPRRTDPRTAAPALRTRLTAGSSHPDPVGLAWRLIDYLRDRHFDLPAGQADPYVRRAVGPEPQSRVAATNPPARHRPPARNLAISPRAPDTQQADKVVLAHVGDLASALARRGASRAERLALCAGNLHDSADQRFRQRRLPGVRTADALGAVLFARRRRRNERLR